MKPSAVLKEGHKDITLMLQIVEKVSQQLEKNGEFHATVRKIKD